MEEQGPVSAAPAQATVYDGGGSRWHRRKSDLVGSSEAVEAGEDVGKNRVASVTLNGALSTDVDIPAAEYRPASKDPNRVESSFPVEQVVGAHASKAKEKLRISSSWKNDRRMVNNEQRGRIPGFRIPHLHFF
ncbi:hypothetical protein ACFX2J_046307 [Malus domestica]